MWKSVVGHNVSMKVAAEGDDWETDPDFENDVSEQEQRWGAKTIEGSGRAKEHISVAELRNKVAVEHEQVKQKEYTPKTSYGYGGKFGVEKDRMDKAAVGHDYVAQVEQHSSQKDMAKGFGGKFGVQKDRVDKSALGFEYKGEVERHTSQKDYAKGFGGKYGVEKEKVDKASLGYDYKGETEKHQSQKDYSKGFGGKFGIEKDKVDKAVVGYDYRGETEKHQSQKAGFGGGNGGQVGRVNKDATDFLSKDSPSSVYEKTKPVEASSAGAGKLKARFESLAKVSEEENRRKVEEERARRQARESREREEVKRKQELKDEEVEPPPVDKAPEYNVPPVEAYYHTPEKEEMPTQEVEEEQEYDEPPALPPRPEDFEEEAPPLPGRSLEEDEGDYDEIIEAPPLPTVTEVENEYEDLSHGQKAIAIYDYQGEAEDEISFNPDDIITNIEMIDEGWWKGQCHGHFGLFPASYVQLI
ncbi:hematopoietic lineage cell-specific protein [Oryzias latipes]|uniref:Hematopoietic lineage cell-specific protein n=1 Tax=Oryzias latipes TaxID=8090 RepID=H2MMD7_ORYLA|nr:hematopoietic lineage cell-specific protein [Oryzias latipes]